jgi:hypothetical protein
VGLLTAQREAAEALLEAKRAQNAERQARFKDRQNGARVTLPNVRPRHQTLPAVAKEIPPDPHKKIHTPPMVPSGTTPQGERATRLPDDFTLPADWIGWAVEKRGWSTRDAADEGECFCRYWQAKGGRDAAKRSWRKTWENWVVNSRREGAERPTHTGSMLAHLRQRAA